MFPVAKTETVAVRPTAKVDDERKDDETDDGDDLDTGETEFGFTIDGDREDVQADDENDNDRDPRGDVDTHSSMPELYDDGGGRDFSTEGDCRLIPILAKYELEVFNAKGL